MHEIDAEKAGNRAGTQSSAHILVVDDEVALTRLLVELLEYHGYRVTAMDSSGAALAFFEDNYRAVDLVVADETMPGMTGLELLRRMRALRPDLPTVLCSGYSDAVDKEQAQALGVSRFFRKPVKSAILLGALSDLLAHRGQ